MKDYLYLISFFTLIRVHTIITLVVFTLYFYIIPIKSVECDNTKDCITFKAIENANKNKNR